MKIVYEVMKVLGQWRLGLYFFGFSSGCFSVVYLPMIIQKIAHDTASDKTKSYCQNKKDR